MTASFYSLNIGSWFTSHAAPLLMASLGAWTFTTAPAATIAEMLEGPAPAQIEANHAGVVTPISWLPGTGAQPHAAVVWIHGGAWRGGDAKGFWPQMRYFASRGCATFSVEYRLVKAGGPTLEDAINDCRAALRHVRAHAVELGINPQRIAVAGDSAGGHLAAVLSAVRDTSDDEKIVSSMPNAVILCNAITDLTEAGWPACAGAVAYPKGTPAPRTPELLAWAERWSPIHQVVAPQPPTLLMHGLKDGTVPPAQSERYLAKLKSLGAQAELITLPEARHAFIVTKYSATEATLVESWSQIDRYLVRQGYLQGEPTLVVAAKPAAKP